MFAAPTTGCLCLTATLAAGSAVADAAAAGKAFADHCFSPHLTAATALASIGPSGARIDFYDLRPFSAPNLSPVTGRAATPGTDRRCEVSFDGDDTPRAIEWLTKGLTQEGLADKQTPVPADFARHPGTVLIAAAQLNPNRIAVVQVGQRPYERGTETFMSVERLVPLDEEAH